MEMIKFRCACGATLSVSAFYVGYSRHCPKCGRVVVVPAPRAGRAQAGSGHIDSVLMEDERVLYRAKRHPCPLIGDAVGTVLLMSGLAAAFFAGIVESLRDPQLARGLDPNLDLYVYSTLLIVLVSICAGSVLRQYIVYRTAEFAVTNMRVLSKSGLRSKHTFGILLSDVKGVSVDQGVLGRMLGYGTVIVTGTGGSKELFPCMSAPFEFQKKVQEQIEAIRDQK